MSRLLILLLLPVLLVADDKWIALKSGPFEVYSNVGEKAAREKLMFLEQFRETLRVVTGKEELWMVWPVRVLIVKNAAEILPLPSHSPSGAMRACTPPPNPADCLAIV